MILFWGLYWNLAQMSQQYAQTCFPKSCSDAFPHNLLSRENILPSNPHKLPCISLCEYANYLFFTCSLTVCGCACHCGCLCCRDSIVWLHSQDGLCTTLNTPMVLAIVSAASGCSPFAHRLHWGTSRAGIALILKDTPFLPLPHLLSVTVVLFPPSSLHRFREVNEVRHLLGILLSSLHPSSGCVYRMSRLHWTGSALSA